MYMYMYMYMYICVSINCIHVYVYAHVWWMVVDGGGWMVDGWWWMVVVDGWWMVVDGGGWWADGRWAIGRRPSAPPQVSVLVRADFKKMRFSIFRSVILMHFLYFWGYFSGLGTPLKSSGTL